MLEKLGLPPKPSLRGNSWVVDASHCQGCSSQFTFINRKHHCRRCGGIFCGSCSQQRMVLRGQGDSPVRICEPCKKLEEAARFELRYGHKSRAAKGGSKHASMKDDDIAKDILGNEDKILSTVKTSASCSYIPHSETAIEGGAIIRNLSLNPADTLSKVGSTTTPEDLRKQALVEKSKYKTLKADGKSEEALRAFKRGKDLERQAGALEILLRKNRRKDDLKAPADKTKLLTKKSQETDDLSAELKDLGWSDQDLRDAEKRPATSVEGELTSLVREFSKKPKTEKSAVSSDKSQVIAHKKRALELKRSGNLVEAKDELKRAKILERKIEEEELLGETDDSDDELSSLIRSMDADDHGFSARHTKSDLNFDFGHFTGIADDLAVDGNFEVTDEDMYDPEINSALQSLGWMEDNTADSEDVDRESIVTEIHSLKREALNQKRAGNSAEAMVLLKKAKLLEKELENSDTHETEEPFFSKAAGAKDTALEMAPKSKLVIQKELLALKKKALSLRREGKLDESADELKKAKALEEQLEDMNKAPGVGSKQIELADTLGNEDEEDVTDQDLHDPAYLSLLKNLGWEDEDKNAEARATTSKESNKSSKNTSDSATTQFVANVEIDTTGKSKSEIQRELLVLKRKALSLRRQGEAEEADEVLKMAKLLEEKLNEFDKSSQVKDKVITSLEKPDEIVHEKDEPYVQEPHSSPATVSKPNPSPLQQEILAYKKKAITFKREGKLEEAKEALRQAKLLEKKSMEDKDNNVPQTAATNSSDASSVDKEASPSSVSKPLSSRDRFKLQQESLGHKRQALKLRREGRTAEADSEFELAKAIEARLQEWDTPDPSGIAEPADDVIVENFLDPQLLSMLQSVGLDDGWSSTSQGVESTTKSNADANAEREQLVERIKAEKVKAMNLKRSGKQAEALDALRRAKLYEKKLENL